MGWFKNRNSISPKTQPRSSLPPIKSVGTTSQEAGYSPKPPTYSRGMGVGTTSAQPSRSGVKPPRKRDKECDIHKLTIKDRKVFVDDFELKYVTEIKRDDGLIMKGYDAPLAQIQITMTVRAPFDVVSNDHYYKDTRLP